MERYKMYDFKCKLITFINEYINKAPYVTICFYRYL